MMTDIEELKELEKLIEDVGVEIFSHNKLSDEDAFIVEVLPLKEGTLYTAFVPKEA